MLGSTDTDGVSGVDRLNMLIILFNTLYILLMNRIKCFIVIYGLGKLAGYWRVLTPRLVAIDACC
jgi:hypothetical protein